MPWQNVFAVLFQAGNTVVINSSGLFVYTGTPALGNLIFSVAPAAGTDSFGNAFIQGFAAYNTVGGQRYATSIGVQNNLASLFTQNLSSQVFLPPYVAGVATVAGGTENFVNSGAATNVANPAQLVVQDSVFSGTAGGFAQLAAGLVALGASAGCSWNDNELALALPSSGTPATPASGCKLHAGAGTGALFLVKPSGRNDAVSQGSSGSGGQTVTQAAFNDISDAYTISGTDVVAGTVLRLTAFGHGTFGSTLQNLFMEVNGGFANSEVPTAGQTANGNCLWTGEALIKFTSATVANIHMRLSCSGFPGVSWTAHGNTTGQAITFPFTFKLQAEWASTTGAPTITCDGSIFDRVAN